MGLITQDIQRFRIRYDDSEFVIRSGSDQRSQSVTIQSIFGSQLSSLSIQTLVQKVMFRDFIITGSVEITPPDEEVVLMCLDGAAFVTPVPLSGLYAGNVNTFYFLSKVLLCDTLEILPSAAAANPVVLRSLTINFTVDSGIR